MPDSKSETLCTAVQNPKYKTVAVLKGGWSVERDVSLISGTACALALKEVGYQVKEIDVTSDVRQLMDDLAYGPDVVYNALHGRGGEDGCIQGLLDILGMRYSHSGRLASALAMDKARAKTFVADKGVRVIPGEITTARELLDNGTDRTLPYVIKPNAEGSSVGIHIVRERDNRIVQVLENWRLGEILCEEFIIGRELTVTVMSDADGNAEALGVTEILPRTAFYDYEAKYAHGGSEHKIPADISDEVAAQAMEWAITAHKALGCSGVTRTDFRYDDSQSGTDGLYFLEVNTQPGMTPTSLSPEQAAYRGLDFPHFVQWMVEHALCHTQHAQPNDLNESKADETPLKAV